MDLALIHLSEEVVLRIAKSLAKETKQNNLVWQVVLLSIDSKWLIEEGYFDNIWVHLPLAMPVEQLEQL